MTPNPRRRLGTGPCPADEEQHFVPRAATAAERAAAAAIEDQEHAAEPVPRRESASRRTLGLGPKARDGRSYGTAQPPPREAL